MLEVNKVFWNNAFRKSVVIDKHLMFFLSTCFFENFICVFGVTQPRIVISNVVLWYRWTSVEGVNTRLQPSCSLQISDSPHLRWFCWRQNWILKRRNNFHGHAKLEVMWITARIRVLPLALSSTSLSGCMVS